LQCHSASIQFDLKPIRNAFPDCPPFADFSVVVSLTQFPIFGVRFVESREVASIVALFQISTVAADAG